MGVPLLDAPGNSDRTPIADVELRKDLFLPVDPIGLYKFEPLPLGE